MIDDSAAYEAGGFEDDGNDGDPTPADQSHNPFPDQDHDSFPDPSPDNGDDPFPDQGHNPFPDQGNEQGLGDQSEDAQPTPDDADHGPVDDGAPIDPDYPDVVVDGQLVGDPQDASEHWFQQAADGYCLPASIAEIVSEYTGIDYTDESAFVELANSHHLFGTRPDGGVGISFGSGVQLLEQAGVPVTLGYGDIDALAEDLAEGRGVIVCIDSGEVWDPSSETVEDDTADHAVVVTGIDTERGIVYLSDPGSPDGNMEQVPLAAFADAWADSHNAMIVCDQPGPDVAQLVDQTDVTITDTAPADRNDPTQSTIQYALARPAGWVLLPCCLPASTIGASAS